MIQIDTTAIETQQSGLGTHIPGSEGTKTTSVPPAGHVLVTSDAVREAPAVRPSILPSTTTLPLFPRTSLEAEIMTTSHIHIEEMPPKGDDITIDFPPLFDDDDRHDGGENCDFALWDCPADPKYWISVSEKDKPDGTHKRFYCPRHFALRLHNIIDEVTHNTWFDEQPNPASRRAALQTYFLDWGRID